VQLAHRGVDEDMLFTLGIEYDAAPVTARPAAAGMPQASSGRSSGGPPGRRLKRRRKTRWSSRRRNAAIRFRNITGNCAPCITIDK